MNPETTIRTSIWKFPQVNPTRAAVLHHYFYVIGNGYAWENGELVGGCHLYSDDEAYIGQEFDYPPSPSEWKQEFIDKWNGQVDLIRSEIDLRCKSMEWPYPLTSLYPRCPNHAHIFNIPADCTPEWLAVAYEAASFFEPLYALDSV